MTFWNSDFRKQCWGFAARLLCADSAVRIGPGFTCDGVPNIWHTADGTVEIGRDVYFRRHVEIRAHHSARVIIGDGVRIDRDVRILATENAVVEIGAGCSIGMASVLNAKESISIGEKVLVSGFVYLQTSMHTYAAPGAIKDLGYTYAPIRIGTGAWIGAHAVVMPGVSMGEGSVLGANAVLTADAEAEAIYAGVPARRLRGRFGEQP